MQASCVTFSLIQGWLVFGKIKITMKFQLLTSIFVVSLVFLSGCSSTEKAANSAADQAEKIADKVEKAADKMEKAVDRVEKAAEKAGQMADNALDKASQMADRAADKAGQIADKAADKAAAGAQAAKAIGDKLEIKMKSAADSASQKVKEATAH